MASVNGMRLIHSAGGVVWRPAADDPEAVEIAVVHRERYDDWSLPKGKLDPGEHVLAAAVREVREETGVVAAPQVRLPSSRYLTGEPDAEKLVDFWSMRAVTVHDFTPNNEIADVRWVRPDGADQLLTYVHDRGLVNAFTALPRVTGVAVLIRHARAGSRAGWDGSDETRPLDDAGRRQADTLGPLLSLFKPVRVYAAPVTRCIETVAAIGLPVRTDTVFAEATAAAPKAVAGRIRALVAKSGRVVIASQGGVIPAAVAALGPPNASAGATFQTPKGTGWVLSFADGDLIAADLLA